MVVIIMGISGSGKTTVGQLLARKLGLPFYDADDFHPEANIQKMSSGQPLNDDDRFPWLRILGNKIQQWENEGGAVLACSALKESYREMLSTIPDSKLYWVVLEGSKEVIEKRMNQREDHFFEAGLIDSQLATLEKPGYGIHIDITKTPGEIVSEIEEAIQHNERSKQKNK